MIRVDLSGHSAVIHGCTIEDEAFVGMSATLLDGVIVEKHGVVAAGSLVRQNTRIPCGQVQQNLFQYLLYHLSCPTGNHTLDLYFRSLAVLSI